MSTDPRRRAWLELDGRALLRNYRTAGDAAGPGRGLIPMVKADGYGLGVQEVVARLEGEAPSGYGVASVAEGLELRAAGVRRPVLVFTPLPPGQEGEALRAGLTPTVSSGAALRRLVAAARETESSGEFHLEVDTGMGRAGVSWFEAGELLGGIEEARAAGLRWGGCFTHFHSAEEPDGVATALQLQRFHEALRTLSPLPPTGFLVHVCNSAALFRLPESLSTAARPGIFLYGGTVGEGVPEPEEVVSLRARVVLVREVPGGSTVGYGATHTAPGPRRWATVALGYGDGLPRMLGNRGRALVRGTPVPMVGRISMDMTVLDVSEVEGGVEVGEVATFLGRDGEAAIPLEEVAALAGTIHYEILTGFTQRLPRVWGQAIPPGVGVGRAESAAFVPAGDGG